MGAYSLYSNNSYEEAVAALDRFIQLHPSNKDIPYAYYLRALCFYERISDVSRDQGMTREAMKTLRQLIGRFPNGKYAKDARIKLELTLDHLAGKQMDIGRYYMRRGQYLAAVNRFKIVIDDYQTTTHVPEALHRMAESYTALGMRKRRGRPRPFWGIIFRVPNGIWIAMPWSRAGTRAAKTAKRNIGGSSGNGRGFLGCSQACPSVTWC